MKRLLFTVILIVAITHVFCSIERQNLASTKAISVSENNDSRQVRRPAPTWSFGLLPQTLMTSYYDFMIGSYNNSPLCIQPIQPYGGYFLTFHAKRSLTGQRRVFYSYISDTGQVLNINELTSVQNYEGYPALAVDPDSGKPIYAWHAQTNTTVDIYDVQCSYDAFISGAAGLISEPITIFDNPITMPAPYNTTDNEYIWPSIQIGPSPTAGMRRVYILARNTVGHIGTPSFFCENVRIAYADFNTDMLVNVVPLTWSYTSIPELDDWNHDDVNSRRPSGALTVGDDGRIYYMGYHSARVASTEANIDEPDLDVFVCDNFGQGTWQRYSTYSKIPSWNPPTNFGGGVPYLTDSNNVPVANDELFWRINNSDHMNTVIDENDILHSFGMWNLTFNESNINYDLLQYNTIKEIEFNANTNQFDIKEIYPICGTSSDSLVWQPWDTDGNGIVDAYLDNGDPVTVTDWNYPYWDQTAHNNAMAFHYNNFKVTKPNSQGWMAAVWQNSQHARLFNENIDTGLQQYSQVPEIYLSVSADLGVNWSQPIVINSVDIPQFAGNTPMWVYPADLIRNIGIVNGHPTGRLGLMFFDDDEWGANCIEVGAIGLNGEGRVKFMTIDIDFSSSLPPEVNVTGNVRGGIPAANLSNALVSLTGETNYSTTSDQSGHFLIANVVSGQSYSITISKPGYASFSEVVNIPALDYDLGIYTLTELALPPSAVMITPVTGNNSVLIEWQPAELSDTTFRNSSKNLRYLAAKDRHLEGYTILRLEQGDESNEATWEQVGYVQPDVSSFSDSSWCSLPQGVYRYAIKAVYSNNQYSSVVFSDLITRNTFGSVSGRVTDKDNVALSDATVRLTGTLNGVRVVYSAITDDTGRFNISNVWYGMYNLECVVRYYLPYTQSEVYVTETQDTFIGMNLADNLISPVNLYATVDISKSVVSLSWQPPLDSSTRTLYGYKIWRLQTGDEQNPQHWAAVSELLTVQYLQDTSWTNLSQGYYKYAIKAVYAAGEMSEASFSNALYNDFEGLNFNRILSCCPSPFSVSTQISYAMKEPSTVKVDIYNLHGQLIRNYKKYDSIRGINFISWDGSTNHSQKAPSGMYIIRMQANGATSKQKVMLLK